ncbi:MAG: hypothetical protein E7555_01365 [Ruminococcaceae bacterium]|nr:hypothetical protein [Oscillospiraceae bacterium]
MKKLVKNTIEYQMKVSVFMIKGVNHQVVEVNKPACEYFEKVLFFVKPEYASLGSAKISEKANSIAVNTGSPPRARKRGKKRVYSAFSPVIWATIGAVTSAIIIKCFGL